MPRFLLGYVRVVDGFNRRVGRFAMYGIFVMMGILTRYLIAIIAARPYASRLTLGGTTAVILITSTEIAIFCFNSKFICPS